MTDVHVSIGARADRAERIYAGLRAAILDGRLRPGERLLATRELAVRLTVSRNTVATAYDRLAAEGYLVSRVGRGTFVSSQQFETSDSRRASTTGIQPRRIWRSPWEPPWRQQTTIAYDFNVGTPDASLFPLETWRRLVTRSLRPASLGSGGYGDPGGNARLRTAIARHVGVSRSVRAHADDVLVTQGAQQAFDLLGRVLIEPGDTIAVEAPGYPPVRHLFESLGAHVVGVPVGGEGIDVSALPEHARLVYVTPSHQFPLGTIMSLARRAALLEWAGHHDAAIIEDDYDSEYRYEDRPLEPLQSLDTSGRVVYVGTFSKTLLPALRLGFIVAPRSLLAALRNAKRLTDWQSGHETQAAAASLIDTGMLARHLRKARAVYAERRRLIIETIRCDFADALELLPSAAGLHVCARLTNASIDPDRVVTDAATLGLRIQSLSPFYDFDAPVHALVIGFGAIATDDIRDGLRLLQHVIERSSYPQMS